MIYEFTPTQDLHGYDEPWAPGGGVNQLPPAAVETKTNNGVTVTSNGDGTYIVSGRTASGSANISFDLLAEHTIAAGEYLHIGNSEDIGNSAFSLEKTGGGSINNPSMTPANRIVAISSFADQVVGRFRIYVAANTSINMTIKPMICESSTAIAFAPYSNICPPEGFNIWDPINAEYIQVYAGYVNANTRELYLRPVYEEYAGEELVGPWMSSLDPYAEDTTPTEGAFVIDFGGELTSFEITPFMLQTLLDSLGIRQHFTDGAGLLNSLMDQAQGRVRSEEELLHLSRPLKVIAIGDQLPPGITIKPISKDVLPGLPGKFIR